MQITTTFTLKADGYFLYYWGKRQSILLQVIGEKNHNHHTLLETTHLQNGMANKRWLQNQGHQTFQIRPEAHSDTLALCYEPCQKPKVQGHMTWRKRKNTMKWPLLLWCDHCNPEDSIALTSWKCPIKTRKRDSGRGANKGVRGGAGKQGSACVWGAKRR